MALIVGDLVYIVRADTTGLRRGLADVQRLGQVADTAANEIMGMVGVLGVVDKSLTKEAQSLRRNVDVTVELGAASLALKNKIDLLTEGVKEEFKAGQRLIKELQKEEKALQGVKGQLDPVEKAAAKYTIQVETLAKALKSDTIKLAEHNKLLEVATRRFQAAQLKAGGFFDALTRLAKAEHEAKQGASRFAAELAKVQARIDPVAVATKRFDKAVTTLSDGLIRNLVSQKDFDRQLKLLVKELDAVKAKSSGVAKAQKLEASATRQLKAEIDKERTALQALRQTLGVVQSSTRRFRDAQTTLTKALKRGEIGIREYNNLLRKARKDLGGATEGVSRFTQRMQRATKSIQLALGPLSGIAARFTAFTAIIGAANIKIAIFIGLAVAGSVAIFKFSTALISQTRQLEKTLGAIRSVTGSLSLARREYAFVTRVAQELGISLQGASIQFGRLLAASRNTVVQGGGVKTIFRGIASAASALSLSAADTEGIFRAVVQIMSKGTVQAEELRGQLGERIPGAFIIAARSIGVTTQELNKMLETGKVLSADFIIPFAQELIKTFGPEAARGASNFEQTLNRLSNSVDIMFQKFSEGNVVIATLKDLLDAATAGIEKFTAVFTPTPEQELEKSKKLVANLEDRVKRLRDAGLSLGIFGGASLIALKFERDKLAILLEQQKARRSLERILRESEAQQNFALRLEKERLARIKEREKALKKIAELSNDIIESTIKQNRLLELQSRIRELPQLDQKRALALAKIDDKRREIGGVRSGPFITGNEEEVEQALALLAIREELINKKFDELQLQEEITAGLKARGEAERDLARENAAFDKKVTKDRAAALKKAAREAEQERKRVERSIDKITSGAKLQLAALETTTAIARTQDRLDKAKAAIEGDITELQRERLRISIGQLEASLALLIVDEEAKRIAAEMVEFLKAQNAIRKEGPVTPQQKIDARLGELQAQLELNQRAINLTDEQLRIEQDRLNLKKQFKTASEIEISQMVKLNSLIREAAAERNFEKEIKFAKQRITILQLRIRGEEKLANILEAQLEVEKQFPTITDERRQQLIKLTAEEKRLEDQLKKNNKLANDFGNIFASAFEKALSEGATFKELINSIEKDIIKLITRLTITEPLQEKFRDFFGKAGSGEGGGGFLDKISSFFGFGDDKEKKKKSAEDDFFQGGFGKSKDDSGGSFFTTPSGDNSLFGEGEGIEKFAANVVNIETARANINAQEVLEAAANDNIAGANSAIEEADLQQVVFEQFQVTVTQFQQATQIFQQAVTALQSQVIPGLQQAAQEHQSAAQALSSAAKALQSAASALQSSASSSSSFLGSLGGMAGGGILRPGEIGLVGEEGTELAEGGPGGTRITPIGRLPAGGITINVFGVTDAQSFIQSEAQIVSSLMQRFTRGERRFG